jgi:hypothetical protein
MDMPRVPVQEGTVIFREDTGICRAIDTVPRPFADFVRWQAQCLEILNQSGHIRLRSGDS